MVESSPRSGADVVVAFGNVPVRYPGRSAVLMHDPHLFYPGSAMRHLSWKSKVRKRFFRSLFRILLVRQDVVFPQTEATASRVDSMHGPRVICVVPNAVSSLVVDSDEFAAPVSLAALDLSDIASSPGTYPTLRWISTDLARLSITSIEQDPAVGRIMSSSSLIVVDVPAPFGPRNPKISP